MATAFVYCVLRLTSIEIDVKNCLFGLVSLGSAIDQMSLIATHLPIEHRAPHSIDYFFVSLAFATVFSAVIF